jgi:aryl-phospho-beta-D-glucosidase BglC (GH1 family)
MNYRVCFVMLSLILGLTATSSPQAVHASRASGASARLQRGINLPFWFWLGPTDRASLDARFTDADFAQLAGWGFTFVRVPIAFEFLHDESAPTLINAENLAYLTSAVQRINRAGLAAIIEIHHFDQAGLQTNTYSGALETDPTKVTLFVRFWGNLAAYLARDLPAEAVVFQPINEPVFEDAPERWLPIQAQLIASIRQAAPQHTIIASAARWQSYLELPKLEPLDDPNIIYDFHFYEPFPFTHQGASWVSEVFQVLRNVPYPSSPENVAPLLNDLTNAESRETLSWYGQERWDKAKIGQQLDTVAAWAKRHNVQVICSEFGALRDVAPPADRIRWITDVRESLEARNIGWAMWEYDNSFGLFRYADFDAKTGRQLDEAVLQALGMPR